MSEEKYSVTGIDFFPPCENSKRESSMSFTKGLCHLHIYHFDCKIVNTLVN